MSRKVRSLLVLAVILLALPASALAAPPAQAQSLCAAVAVNVREGPGGGYRRAAIVNRGECIAVLGLSPDGQWYQVAQGWVWAAPHLWNGAPAQPAGLVSPAPASAAGAHTVSTIAWVSDPAPRPGQDIVAYALIQIDGVPRAGIPVDFAWGAGANAPRCTAVTDALGAAGCLRNVGGEAPGVLTPIQISFRAYGRNYSAASAYAVNGACNPAYPDFCLPAGLPPQTCASIPYRNFAVLPPDAHGFDPDGNGVGCES